MSGSTTICCDNARYPAHLQISRRPFTVSTRLDSPSTSTLNARDYQSARLLCSPHSKAASLNSTPKKKHETVVNYEFSEDSAPPSSCCCGKVKVQVGCRVVAIFSLLAIIANAILYFFGVPRLGLSGTIEIVILIVDFATVLFLFVGLSKKRARLLMPYLVFNSVWTLLLCLLLLVCLWKLIKGGELSNNIISNLHNMREKPTEDDYSYHRQKHNVIRGVSNGVSCLVTAAVMFGLITVIIVDILFLHVVYRTFHFFAYQKEKTKRIRANHTSTTDL